MQTLSEIRAKLAERGLRPRRRFGQNFLHDHRQLTKLVDAADLASGDLVLEVGPGTGALTCVLLERGAEVIACEIDRDLAALIRDEFGERVQLIEGDCLAAGRTLAPEVVDALGGRPFRLVANLPYQAASPLMTTLALEHPACRGQFVTIQKEVADRLLASPGSKTYGPLGILVQSGADIERLAVLPPGCFWPAPKVTSAMVAVHPHERRTTIEDAGAWMRFVSGLFSKRRKQLGSILGREHALPDGVSSDQRPETLTVTQLLALWRLTRRTP